MAASVEKLLHEASWWACRPQPLLELLQKANEKKRRTECRFCGHTDSHAHPGCAVWKGHADVAWQPVLPGVSVCGGHTLSQRPRALPVWSPQPENEFLRQSQKR